MDGTRTLFSLTNEETARLNWFEAFMRGRCGVLLLRPSRPTESIIRIELERQMYVDCNRVHEPATDCPEYRISGLEALLEGAPVLPDPKLLWHHALEELLDGTRDGLKHSYRGSLRSETKINGRTAQSNRRAGEVERSDGSHGNVNRQRRE